MRRAFYDIAALAARSGMGGIFAAYGWYKLQAGLAVTEQQFTTAGIPMPGPAAAGSMLIELIGAALLITGIAVPVVVVLLFAETIGVFVAGGGQILPVGSGGLQLLVALGAVTVLLAVGGAGRISLWYLLFSRRSDQATADADATIAGLRGPAGDRDEPTAELRRPRGGSAPRRDPPPGKLVAPLRRDKPADS